MERVCYLETDDYQAALAGMAETEVNRLWQRDMAPFFAELSGRRPDKGFRRIAEISTWTDAVHGPGAATRVRK